MTDGEDGIRDEQIEESSAAPAGNDSGVASRDTLATDEPENNRSSEETDDETRESGVDDRTDSEGQSTGGTNDVRRGTEAETQSEDPSDSSHREKYAPHPHWEYGPQPAGEDDNETDRQRSEELLAYTTGRRSLSPRVQILWAVRTSITAFIFGLIAGFVATNFGLGPRISGVFVVLFLLVGWVWVVARYRVWVYQIREDAMYLERGVFRHVRSLVPYVRIQHVDTSRGPLERALGLSTLVVYTAGSRGADVSIPGLTPEEASDLQQRVKELAIEADGGDAL